MKKIQLLLLLIMLVFVANAQKLYSTKTAQIKFDPFEKNYATNNQVFSALDSKTGVIVFKALIKGFKFDNSLMEDHFNENYMESSSFPNADFKGSITNLKEVDFSKNGTYKVNVEGTLTIHATPNKITTTGTIEIAEGKVTAKSSIKIKVKDYGIKGAYIGEKINGVIELMINSKYN